MSGNIHSASPSPAVSVVIPSYNRAHCIVRTLDSVFSQTFTDYETIVIDDGSTDGTAEVLRPYLDRINYIIQENGGLAEARNRGVKEARGEWIAFLDSDDLWLPEKLEVQIAAVKRTPGLAVHVTNAGIFREHLAVEKDLYQLSGFRPAVGQDSTRLDAPFIPCIAYGLAWMQCALVRRATFLEVGPFRPELKIFMDFEMGARLTRQGPWEAHHPPLVRILRQDDGEVESISSRSSTPAGRRELIEVYALMAALPGLSVAEKRFIQRRLSDARGRFGLQLSYNGDAKEGRRQVGRAYKEYRRTGSLAKVCTAWMPGPLRRALIPRLFPNSIKIK